MFKLPTIEFVDKLYKVDGTPTNNNVTGQIWHPSMEIKVRRMTKDKLVVIHELGHWLLYVLGAGPKSKWHVIFDKHFTVCNQKARASND